MSNDDKRAASNRVLLLGLDGLAYSFLEAPLVARSMPNLRALLESSSGGTLLSTWPAYTGPAWTTITTGVDPGRHGIFGFTDSAGHPISDVGVTAPRLWDYVGAAGGRSIVVNVPITHPPRSVEGMLISGMPAPPGSSYTWPHQLASDLEKFDYVVDVAVQEGAREGKKTLHRLARMTEARGRAAAWLASTEPWDLFAAVFVLPDRLGHPWWKHLVPGHPVYETRAASRIRRLAAEPLVALDNAIGDLLSSVPSGTSVLVCSDHGFGPLRADVFFDLILARAGLIDAQSSTPLGRALTSVGRSKAARLAPEALHRWARDKASGGPAAKRQRRAWTTAPYESGIRLEDPEDHEVGAMVVDLLREFRDPAGDPVVQEVWRREEVYHGDRVHQAPELLCKMLDESVGLHDGLHASQPWVSRDQVAWGTHTSEGVISLSGAGVPGVSGGKAADVTPTVLSLLGLEAAKLDGASLIDVGSKKKAVTVAISNNEKNLYSPDEEAAVLEHLRGLGYVE